MDMARKRTTKAIEVAAAAVGSPLYGDSTLRLLTVSASAKESAPYFSEAVTASRRAYEEAGIGPEDIDIAELPDNSSWHELEYFEADGFCKPGEAGRLLNEGYSDIGGRLPVNMSGGMASFGEVTGAQGLQQVCDCARQMRGTAPYQVPKQVKTAFCQTYGGYGNNSVAILKC
jgi:acetyl-CoA acetyltransferase